MTAAEYNEIERKLEEARVELDKSEEEIRELREHLAEIEKLKDKSDLKQLKSRYADTNAPQRFEELVKTVRDQLSGLPGRAVQKFALCDRYNLPYRIDFNSDAELFEDAVRYGFVSLDPQTVNWSERKMSKLRSTLGELEAFVAENEKVLEEQFGEDTALDPQNQGFWEAHYKL